MAAAGFMASSAAAVTKNPHRAQPGRVQWIGTGDSRDNAPMSEEQPIAPPPVESVPNDPPAADPVRSEPPPPDPRRRLRELLAIPDHQRTDAIWDEIIELEICLAPGNRIAPGGQPEPSRRQGGPGQGQGHGRRQEQARRPDAAPGVKPAKRFFKKPKRPPGSQPKP